MDFTASAKRGGRASDDRRGRFAVAAQLKFEQPATRRVVDADAVKFQCADLGHRGDQLHAHFALRAAGLRLHDGGNRRQADEVFIVEGGDLARLIARVGHRRGEVKAHRLPQAQAEGALRQADFVPFLAAARQHADAASLLAAFFEDQEVAARRAAADASPVPLADQRVGDCAAGHGDVRVVVVQQAQRRAAPVAERVLAGARRAPRRERRRR
jgi:hypothetical protein